MSRRFHRFVNFAKVNEELREVWGDGTVEEIDKQKEIVRFSGAVKAFTQQEEYFSKATRGKSKGNIRAMHLPIAAGKIIAWDADEKRKAIPIGTKITDDKEWGKCKDGTYIGFSIGGEVTKEHTEIIDGQEINVIDEFNLVEVSLVDNPACPSAVFSVVKLAEDRAEDPAPAPDPVVDPPAEVPPPSPAPTPDDGETEEEAEEDLEKADEATTVQTLIFSKEKFKSADDAKAWARDHDFKASKVDETEDSYRLRQRDPGDFKESSFRTIELKDGVQATVGHLKMAIGRFGKILKAVSAVMGKMEKRSESMSLYPAMCALRDLQSCIESEAFEIMMGGEDAAQEKADIGVLSSCVDALLEFIAAEFEQQNRSYLAAEASPNGQAFAFMEWADTLTKSLSPTQLQKVLADDDMKENLDAIHRMGHGLVKASAVMGSGCPDGDCPADDGDGEEEDLGKDEQLPDDEGEDAGGDESGAGDGTPDSGDGTPPKKEEKKVAGAPGMAKVVRLPALAGGRTVPKRKDGNQVARPLQKVREEVGAVRDSFKSLAKRVETLEALPAAIGRTPRPHDKTLPGPDATPFTDPLALLKKRAAEEKDPVMKQKLSMIVTEETIKLQQAGVAVE